MISTLSQEACAVIDHYRHLRIGSTTIQCPYYNNRRSAMRGGLRVLIGKGSPTEIEEEVTVLGLRTKTQLSTLNPDQLKQFLVSHNIGIDCSGFAYYVLDAELFARQQKKLKQVIAFPFSKGPLRRLLVRTRPIENISVKVLAHETNSTEVSLENIQPGDMICMVGTGYTGVLDHVVIVSDVTYGDAGKPQHITYAHSLQWSADGRFNHGVRFGTITIKNLSASIAAQEWKEQDIGNVDKNGTFRRARAANSLTIRRLNALLD